MISFVVLSPGALIVINKLKAFRAKLNGISGSKWGGGIGLLWRGNSASSYAQAIIRTLFSGLEKKPMPADVFLFESSRVAIYQFAKSIELSSQDRVQILGFTCEAVTDAIKPFGSKISLYDCDNSLRSQSFKLQEDTKLLICQVTFGVCALSDKFLDLAESKGVYILLDKSLSYGGQDFCEDLVVRYPQVLSFEVSKSFTVGWGGMLRVPAKQVSAFAQHYSVLRAVSLWDDIGRVVRTWLNLFMVRRGGRVAYSLWLILRILGLHRLSAKSSLSKYHGRSIMGPLSKRILINLVDLIPSALEVSNIHHATLKASLEKVGLRVISHADKMVSTPRIAFLVDEDRKEYYQKRFSDGRIELGFWFDNLPLCQKDIAETNLAGCRDLIKTVVNLPCHWTLSEEEINLMLKCISSFGTYGLSNKQ